MAQGVLPDSISSDLHVFSGNTPGTPFLTWVMSKFLKMRFSLDDVVTMATANPARAINRLSKLGTLQTVAPGDVTMLEMVEGPVELVDTRNNKRTAKVYVKPVQTVASGIALGRPYSAPFSVRCAGLRVGPAPRLGRRQPCRARRERRVGAYRVAWMSRSLSGWTGRAFMG